jgi:transcriptional regulator with XRE-family HTH domain
MRQFNHDPEAVTRWRESVRPRLSKTALAERLGCSLSLVSEIEGGTRNARRDLLEQMAEIFGCDVAELEPRRETAATADVDLQQLRNAERASSDELSDLRR